MTDPDCPFCAAGAGRAVTPVVYEDDDALALFPKSPAALGHTLVVPRRHIPDIWALDPAGARSLTDTVLRVAHALRRALRPDGLNVITSAGAAASQTVFHVHVHLVPRWHGDTFGDIWPRPGPSFTTTQVDDAARTIRAALAEVGRADLD
jgi:histidine triad (HIT) family protein